MGKKYLLYKPKDLNIFPGTHRKSDTAHNCDHSTPRARWVVEKGEWPGSSQAS